MPEQKASVSVKLVHALLTYAKNMGLDLTQSLDEIGLKATDLVNPEARIPVNSFNLLWEQLAHHIEDPHAGLHFAEMSRAQPSGDVLSTVMFNCATVGQAMEKLARYHDLTTDLIQIKIHTEKTNTIYTWESSFHASAGNRHIAEAVICWLYHTLKELGGASPSISGIHFQHPKPLDCAEHQRIFDCPISFSKPRNQIIVPSKGLLAPIPLANPKLLQQLEAIVQEQLEVLFSPDTWSEKVSNLISQTLLKGEKLNIDLVWQLALASYRTSSRRKEIHIGHSWIKSAVKWHWDISESPRSASSMWRFY